MSQSISKINKTYLELVELTTPYLGPSSERFIARQIKNHLNKSPEDIKAKDIPGLVIWIELAMSVLTNDSNLIKGYVNSIKKIQKG